MSENKNTLEMNEENIEMYIHCELCIEENKDNGDESPQEWSNYDVGWTKQGLQIWCWKHNANVLHFDFEGRKIKADSTRRKDESFGPLMPNVDLVIDIIDTEKEEENE